jgi:hypothetical protein
MSFDQKIALWQLIIAGGGLFVAIIAGVLAVLGYRKIIKSTDDNARERQAEIERFAKERQAEMEQSANIIGQGLQEMGKTLTKGVKRDTSLVLVLMLLMILGSWWITHLVFGLGDRVEKIEQEGRQG